MPVPEESQLELSFADKHESVRTASGSDRIKMKTRYQVLSQTGAIVHPNLRGDPVATARGSDTSVATVVAYGRKRNDPTEVGILNTLT